MRGPAVSNRLPQVGENGAVAQLGERYNRTVEARGSSPLSSTRQAGGNGEWARAGKAEGIEYLGL